jgi:hypothetical protein
VTPQPLYIRHVRPSVLFCLINFRHQQAYTHSAYPPNPTKHHHLQDLNAIHTTLSPANMPLIFDDNPDSKKTSWNKPRKALLFDCLERHSIRKQNAKPRPNEAEIQKNAERNRQLIEERKQERRQEYEDYKASCGTEVEAHGGKETGGE